MLSNTFRTRSALLSSSRRLSTAFSRPLASASTRSFSSQEPVRAEYQKMLKDFDELLEKIMPTMRQQFIDCGRPKSTSINKFAFPPEIQTKIGEISQDPAKLDEIVQTWKNTFEYSLKTMHPYFNDKLYAGSDPVGQISEFIVSILNTAVHVYHVAPVFSVMEVECVKFFGKQFGYNEATLDGTINPGGTMSNMMALFAARNEFFPHVRIDGWQPEDRPVAFTPVQSHYSINRGAMLSGMGMKRMINVPVDRWTGEMDPVALDKAIELEISRGNKPFFVNSMAGSTVMGAFDDHNAIADVCEKHGIWHHIDACAGAFLIFSEEARNSIFQGVQRSHSIALNPHKGLGVPQQCSLVLTNGKDNSLRKANTSGADYLFHDNEYAKYDIGDKTLSCGRKADGFKLWMCLQSKGLSGLEENANTVLKKQKHLVNLIKNRSDEFEMVNIPKGFAVCFSYTPPAFRGQEYSYDAKCKVHQMIFDRMQTKGSLLIQHNPLPDQKLPNFFRVTLMGEKTEMEDLEYWLDEVALLGKDITPADL